MSRGYHHTKTDDDGTVRYYDENNKLHREGGPALERPDGYKEWYLNGECHRDGAPAIEDANGFNLNGLSENKSDCDYFKEESLKFRKELLEISRGFLYFLTAVAILATAIIGLASIVWTIIGGSLFLIGHIPGVHFVSPSACRAPLFFLPDLCSTARQIGFLFGSLVFVLFFSILSISGPRFFRGMIMCALSKKQGE